MKLVRKQYVTVLVLVFLFGLLQSIYAQSTAVWSADMEVVEYDYGLLGAPYPDLLTNHAGSDGLEVRWLFYYRPLRVVALKFTSQINTEGLTLYAGDLVLALEDSTGDSSLA